MLCETNKMACRTGITCALDLYDTKPQEDIKELAANWHHIITKWYPDLSTKVYCPSHFRAVYYSEHPDRLKKVQHYTNVCGFKEGHVKLSDVRNDEAQQRMLWTFAAFCHRKNSTNKDQPAFILSNMNFTDYLCKYKPPGTPVVYKPKRSVEGKPDIIVSVEGEADIIVIDKKFGIFILEIKATGDETTTRSTADNHKDLKAAFTRKRKDLVQQVTNHLKKVTSLIDPLHLPVIRAVVLLPNTERQTLRCVLEELKDIKGLRDLVFMCKEDLPSKDECWKGQLTDEKYDAIYKIWTGAIPSTQAESLPAKSYPYIVSLFAGPLTSVRVYYNSTMPRLGKECGKPGSDAHMMAARFSVLVLHSTQIEILVKDQDQTDTEMAQFVHLEGPPGTGKTLTLLIRILTWLDEGHVVWLLSLSPQSRSITHALREQVEHMLIEYRFKQEGMTADETKNYIQRMRMFMMMRPAETCPDDYFEKRLKLFEACAKRLRQDFSLADDEGKVCVALDETLIDSSVEDCAVHQKFFDAVKKLYSEDKQVETAASLHFERGISVWSAALHKGGRPCYVTQYGEQSSDKFGLLWELDFPMRCPPSIQRALMCVQDSQDMDVCCFRKATALAHPVSCTSDVYNQYVADGMPVKLIAHGSHSNKTDSVWQCNQCGAELADYLRNTLHIGETEPAEKTPEKPFPTQDKYIPFASVIIVSTRQAYPKQTLKGGFHTAMAEKRLEIAVGAAREEGNAPMPDSKDVIIVSDMTSIHGLERAVVIIIPDVHTDYSSSQASTGAAASRNETSMDEEGSGDARGGQRCEEDRITAAFASLHENCRRDIFFIGSRTVSQLIVFHSGKEPGEPGPPMSRVTEERNDIGGGEGLVATP